MAQTVVGFTIEIDGINSINSLNTAIADTKKQMAALDLTTEEGVKQFNELSQTLGKLTGQQKALKKAQDDVNKSFLEESSLGAYDKASAKLNRLRKEFKNAALDGSKSAEEMDRLEKEIQQLDRTLKKVDGQVGQFQRNVGNYPRTFQRITRSLTQAIPGFEAFSSQLKNSEGRLNGFGKALIGGFVAFQAVQLIGKAIGRLDEFITKINETKETVAEFSGAYGEDLNKLTASTTALASTFNTDAKTISQAAQALSKQLGIGFEEALGKLEGALVEGRGNADDYLKTITDYPEAFQAASGEITEFSERNKSLLQTNKELAESQVDVARRLQGVNDSFKEAGKQIETGLFLVFAKLIDIFRPVGDAFGRLGATLQNLFSIFNQGGKETSIFTKIIDFLVFPIELLANQLQILADGFAFVIQYIVDFINQSPFLKGVFDTIIQGVSNVYDGLRNLPAVFAGVTEALKQLATNFVNFFQSLYLDAQIFGEQVKGVFGANVKEAIEELRRQRAVVNKDGAAISEAFARGYNDAKKKADEKRKEDEKNVNKAVIKINKDGFKEQQKAAQDAAKKLADDKKKFQEDEIKNERARIALLLDLSIRLGEERIKNIKDEQTRELAEIENKYEQQKRALQKQYDDLVIAAQQREKELTETFGKNSAEVLKVQKDNAKQLEEVQKLQNDILKQLDIQRNTDKEKLLNDGQKKEIEKAQETIEKLKQAREMFLSTELDYIEKSGEMRDLKNKEILNRLLQNETDAKKKEELIRLAGEQETADKIATIRNQIQALNDAEAELLDENKKKRVDISQEEYDAVLLARQRLFTELSDIENQQTQNVKKNAEQQLADRKKSFEDALNVIKDFTDVFFDALNVANERQEARYNESLERSQQRQTMLQEEIDNSTGLRRRFFEQQLEAELASAQKLEQAKEELAKKGAKRQKAQAILQSIINTALAVSAAYFAPPAAPNIPAAILAGILGAAQTGIIAAQPLARGGVVGLGDEVVQFADGGKVTSRGNIKPLSNGDNVLATLKTGEVVLNESQQKRIGYRALKAAKIPNFATGGVVGAPSGFLSDQLNAVSEEANRLNLMQNLIIETQNRIDRLQVVYTASTEDSVDKARNERKEIRVTAQI
jgi:hypothetical protein